MSKVPSSNKPKSKKKPATRKKKAVRRKRTGARSKGGALQKQSEYRLRKIEQRDRQDKLLAQYAAGKSLESIALDEELDMRSVVNAVSAALDRQVKNFSEPSPQHQFVRYAVFNLELIKKLDEARKMFLYDPDGKQYSMIISSVRAQHDIYEAIQKKGTALGVIKKRKADADVTGGGKKRVLKELAKEAELLLEIVDEFDPHTQYKRRRRIQAQIRTREAEASDTVTEKASPNERPFVSIIRKVVREHGIVQRDIPDHTIRKLVYERTADGKMKVKPKSRWTAEDYERTGVEPPKQLTAPTPKVIDLSEGEEGKHAAPKLNQELEEETLQGMLEQERKAK